MPDLTNRELAHLRNQCVSDLTTQGDQCVMAIDELLRLRRTLAEMFCSLQSLEVSVHPFNPLRFEAKRCHELEER